MTYTLTIDGRLKDLNDYQYACRSHYSKGNNLKLQQEEYIAFFIYSQLKNVKIEKLVHMRYQWYEPTRKRDLDNISSFGRKCIQDALVKTGILANDGWKNIKGFSDEFYIDKENPRIVVEITEID
jgi:Holliday junction resolvase RusA-like endonuclease